MPRNEVLAHEIEGRKAAAEPFMGMKIPTWK